MLPDTSPSAPVAPRGSPSPDALTPGGGIATLEDAKKASETMEDAIGQLSEVDDAYVIALDQTALVGVKFDNSYKGEMTERLRQMVAAEVLAADPKIETVAVTAYPDDVEDVYELSDRMLSGKDQDDLKEEINEIVRNATTLR